MGRTRTKKDVAAPPPAPPKLLPSIPSLLEKSQTLIVQCDYELAKRFLSRIFEQQPAHAEAKEMLGVVQLETGDLFSAKETFLSLLPPHPDAPSPPPSSAHLYLAQLSEDDPKAALSHYQAAVELLKVQLKGKDKALAEDSNDEAEVKSNIVRALIGQVEIWMDPSYDLCFEPEAEQTCERLLEEALGVDPGNSEAYQTLASVRLSQQRPEDAKTCLENAWMAWKDLDLDHPNVPPLPTRLSLVKLFLELSLFTPALAVLHGVMSSDDQEVEAWYLEGWCYFLMAEQTKEGGASTFEDMTWEEMAQEARDRLEMCKLLHENESHPDAQLLEHARELIGQLDALGIKPSPMDDDEEGGEWDDIESSGDEDDVQMS